MSKRIVRGALAVGAVLVGLMLTLAAREGPKAAATRQNAPAIPQPAATPPDAIYYNATVVTMDTTMPTAQAIAITGSTITAVGSSQTILALKGDKTVLTDLQNNATILPGFIDPHSHLAGYGFYNDASIWLDVSSINMFFKPLPGDPRCTTPTDPQKCFIPVQNHDDVLARITAAVQQRQASGDSSPVLAFNYDPSRLGATKGCSGLAFQCPNFENGNALNQLDAISKTIPIYVSSESGHIFYVNTPALAMLNICQTPGADPKTCYTPITNPTQETPLAQSGQLEEDLALYAAGVFQGVFLKKNPASGPAAILKGAQIYAQQGYTLTQKGAAGGGLIDIYRVAVTDPDYPVTSAMIAYEPTQPNFSQIIQLAVKQKQAIGTNPKLFVAAVKSFADGSPQGYTAYLTNPYANVFKPFVPPLFASPYRGLLDLSQDELTSRVTEAHQAGFPIIIHTNGDAATTMALTAFLQSQKAYPSPNLRDVALHVPLFSPAQMLMLKAVQNASVSFLISNLHFYGLPECQQVLGPTSPLYPAATAARAGLRVTFHSDSPVTPPDPLFMIWVGKTRQAQQPSWYPNSNPGTCPTVIGQQESFTIQQGLEAFTINAAWAYGLESTMGSITTGKLANLAILSANPLAMESAPDGLQTIRVLGTVHLGRYIKNPHGNLPPRSGPVASDAPARGLGSPQNSEDCLVGRWKADVDREGPRRGMPMRSFAGTVAKSWSRTYNHALYRAIDKQDDELTQMLYRNEDTGVYFVLNVGEPSSELEQEGMIPSDYEDAGISINLNYARPSFFAYESMPVVADIAVHFGLEPISKPHQTRIN